MYSKQKDLWDQVSRRSSLSALSLASAVHKPITKEEKEAANNKKSSPVKGNARNVSQVHFIDNKFIHDGIVPGRALNIRHHLGRTTGLGTCVFGLLLNHSHFKFFLFKDMEDGALLPSPTRDKLMPTIPKSKEDESYSSQRGSPKKSATSRHSSPQKGSPQKLSAQKKATKQSKWQISNVLHTGTKRSLCDSIQLDRSQSVGPTPSTNVDGSPKRQARSGSAAPATASSAAKAPKKAPVATPTIVERRPRPSKLNLNECASSRLDKYSDK